MCKIFAMTNMAKITLNEKLINTIKTEVCRRDNDGFGYAFIDTNNNIQGERTTNPSQFYPFESLRQSKTRSLPIVETHSNSFGRANVSKPKALIGHGRMSTNTVNLDNTHPFVNDNVALIHNGVVYDQSGHVKNSIKTDCDTEILLKYHELMGFEGIEKNVSGYYAIAMLDKSGILHIVRDSKATLFIAWSQSIESYLIATTKEIIENIANSMNWKIDKPEKIVDNVHISFIGNEMTHRRINPLVGNVDSHKTRIAFGESFKSKYQGLSSDDSPEENVCAECYMEISECECEDRDLINVSDYIKRYA